MVVGVKNSTIYVHCSKKINNDGITSLKYYLNGVKCQVESCKKFPLGVKWKMKRLVGDLITKKEKRKGLWTDIENFHSLSNNEVEEDDNANSTSSNTSSQANRRVTMQDTSTAKQKLTLLAQQTMSDSQPNIKNVIMQVRLWQDSGIILMYHLIVLNHTIINQW